MDFIVVIATNFLLVSHNDLKREIFFLISNVCLSGCTITSKAKINVFYYCKYFEDSPVSIRKKNKDR